MKARVLVFPANGINAIEIHDALSYNVNIELFGAASYDCHGPYVYKNYYGKLPMIYSENFIEEFNKLLNEWDIDYVFPTHDTAAMFFAENKLLIRSKIIVSDFETTRICRDKKKTMEVLTGCDFCPTVYSDFINFPCFIKPIDGQGGVGAKIIYSKEDIPNSFNYDKNIIMEYLPGLELSVDCLTNSNGELCVALPRERNRTMAGVSVASQCYTLTEEIRTIAEHINKLLKFYGLWYFQIKQDINGCFKVMEISVRCPGTACLSRAQGVNLPLLSVYVAQGRDITIIKNPYNVKVDRTLISRYKIDYIFDKIYIDYDDTIAWGDNVNPTMLTFLYQCKNKKKKLFLLTRHECDHEDSIYESLSKHCISETLFDRIITLPVNEEKSDYIDPANAIFIDNSFVERKKVHDKLNIPVFDNEGVEVLLDWRF